jgi:hypothetical protein
MSNVLSADAACKYRDVYSGTFQPRSEMSAFAGKADMAISERHVLLTQSGHERFRIAAVQTDASTPFRGSQIPAVIPL